MREGFFYPRWLPKSWDGLGSPTFYFYPPLFFWAAGAISIAGGGLPAQLSMSLASAAFIAASGFAMRAWLRTIVAERSAFLGALVYLFAPYRLHDIYTRGALAEATTYLSLPLILLFIHKIRQGGPGAVAGLTVAYALLIVGHLPVALLGSVTLIPAFALCTALKDKRPDWPTLVRIVAGGVLGLGFAALFLFPAIGLLPFTSAENLYGPGFRPHDSFFFAGPGSLFGENVDDVQMFVATLACGYLAVALVALASQPKSRPIRFWSGLSIACFVMVSGAIPVIWDLPLLHQVQFPSRLLPIIEVVTVTILALSSAKLSRAAFVVPAASVTVAVVLGATMATARITAAAREGAADREIVLAQHRDAVEFLPPGHPIALDDRGRPNPSGIILPDGPEVRTEAPAARINIVKRLENGGLILSSTSPASTEIVLRRYFFPNWKADIGGRPVAVSRAEQALLAVPVGPGTHRVTVRPGIAPFEWVGRIISLVSLLVVILLTAASWRSRAPRRN